MEAKSTWIAHRALMPTIDPNTVIDFNEESSSLGESRRGRAGAFTGRGKDLTTIKLGDVVGTENNDTNYAVISK